MDTCKRVCKSVQLVPIHSKNGGRFVFSVGQAKYTARCVSWPDLLCLTPLALLYEVADMTNTAVAFDLHTGLPIHCTRVLTTYIPNSNAITCIALHAHSDYCTLIPADRLLLLQSRARVSILQHPLHIKVYRLHLNTLTIGQLHTSSHSVQVQLLPHYK